MQPDRAARHAHPAHPAFHRLKGRVKQVLGWLTADRRAEASGEAEARWRRVPDPGTTDRVEHQVKRRYGETLDAPRK